MFCSCFTARMLEYGWYTTIAEQFRENSVADFVHVQSNSCFSGVNDDKEQTSTTNHELAK